MHIKIQIMNLFLEKKTNFFFRAIYENSRERMNKAIFLYGFFCKLCCQKIYIHFSYIYIYTQTWNIEDKYEFKVYIVTVKNNLVLSYITYFHVGKTSNAKQSLDDLYTRIYRSNKKYIYRYIFVFLYLSAFELAKPYPHSLDKVSSRKNLARCVKNQTNRGQSYLCGLRRLLSDFHKAG